MFHDQKDNDVDDIDIGDVPNAKVFSWLVLVVWIMAMVNLGIDPAIFERLKITGFLVVIYFIGIVIMVRNYEKSKFGRYK